MCIPVKDMNVQLIYLWDVRLYYTHTHVGNHDRHNYSSNQVQWGVTLRFS